MLTKVLPIGQTISESDVPIDKIEKVTMTNPNLEDDDQEEGHYENNSDGEGGGDGRVECQTQ